LSSAIGMLPAKPMSEPARRQDVFTGTSRRRTWSTAQKAAIVAESVGGSESVSAVARRHGLTPPQLFTWRRQAQNKTCRRLSGRNSSAIINEATTTPLRKMPVHNFSGYAEHAGEFVLGNVYGRTATLRFLHLAGQLN
jgi:transposase-like protein